MSLTTPEHYRKEYERTSRFQKMHNASIAAIPNHYFQEFRRAVSRLLATKGVVSDLIGCPGTTCPGCDEYQLEYLHNHLNDPESIHYDMDFGVSQVTKLFYETDEEFLNLYHKFLAESLYSYLGIDFYFQKTPTFRFHFPNAQNHTHYPRYHTDVNYGHPPEEINLLIPITANQTLGFKILDVENSKKVMSTVNYDFNILKERSFVYNGDLTTLCDSMVTKEYIDHQDVILFDSRCMHTALARPAIDPTTRISIDVRIYPAEDYKNNLRRYQGDGRQRIKYTIGEAYAKKSIRELVSTDSRSKK